MLFNSFYKILITMVVMFAFVHSTLQKKKHQTLQKYNKHESALYFFPSIQTEIQNMRFLEDAKTLNYQKIITPGQINKTKELQAYCDKMIQDSKNNATHPCKYCCKFHDGIMYCPLHRTECKVRKPEVSHVKKEIQLIFLIFLAWLFLLYVFAKIINHFCNETAPWCLNRLCCKSKERTCFGIFLERACCFLCLCSCCFNKGLDDFCQKCFENYCAFFVTIGTQQKKKISKKKDEVDGKKKMKQVKKYDHELDKSEKTLLHKWVSEVQIQLFQLHIYITLSKAEIFLQKKIEEKDQDFDDLLYDEVSNQDEESQDSKDGQDDDQEDDDPQEEDGEESKSDGEEVGEESKSEQSEEKSEESGGNDEGDD